MESRGAHGGHFPRRQFDLDDVRAEVAQVSRRERSGQHGRAINDTKAFEWQGQELDLPCAVPRSIRTPDLLMQHDDSWHHDNNDR